MCESFDREIEPLLNTVNQMVEDLEKDHADP